MASSQLFGDRFDDGVTNVHQLRMEDLLLVSVQKWPEPFGVMQFVLGQRQSDFTPIHCGEKVRFSVHDFASSAQQALVNLFKGFHSIPSTTTEAQTNG